MSTRVIKPSPKPREPRTREEWQEAVDWAHWALHLDAARQYGLITGGPAVNLERCVEILRLGKASGIRPTSDAVERLTRQFLEASR